MPKKRKPIELKCIICGMPFLKHYGRQKTCSDECSKRHFQNVQNELKKAKYHAEHPEAVFRAKWGEGKRYKGNISEPESNKPLCLHNSCVVCKGGDCMTCAFNTEIELNREIRSFGF